MPTRRAPTTEFGRFVDAKLKELGNKPKAWLAREIGVHWPTLQDWYKGATPEVTNLSKIEKALRLDQKERTRLRSFFDVDPNADTGEAESAVSVAAQIAASASTRAASDDAPPPTYSDDGGLDGLDAAYNALAGAMPDRLRHVDFESARAVLKAAPLDDPSKTGGVARALILAAMRVRERRERASAQAMCVELALEIVGSDEESLIAEIAAAHGPASRRDAAPTLKPPSAGRRAQARR